MSLSRRISRVDEHSYVVATLAVDRRILTWADRNVRPTFTCITGRPTPHRFRLCSTKEESNWRRFFERMLAADPFAAADRNRGDALLSVIAGERASQGPGNKIVWRQNPHCLAGLIQSEVLRPGTHTRS